jgi:hypothetical protein
MPRSGQAGFYQSGSHQAACNKALTDARPAPSVICRTETPLRAGAMTVVKQAGVSFVDIAILRFLLFALMKAFQDRRAPWYQRGLIRKPPA